MSWNRESLQTIKDRVKADFESQLATDGSLLRRAFATILAFVIAGACHLLYGFIEYIAKQILPDTSDETNTLRHGSLRGVQRVPAAYASGSVDMTGTDGTVIEAETLMQRSDGWQYEVQDDVTIAAGVATVAVVAVDAGLDGDCDAGVALTLVTSIAGVSSSGVVATGGISGGADVEALEAWRARIIADCQEPPMGGSEADYKKWALEVPGVTRAWVFPEWLGPGTVGVCFVRDGDGEGAAIIPDAAEVEAVQDYIDEARPVTANVTVFAPTPVYIDHTLSVYPDTAAVRAAVEAELADLYYRDGAADGSTVYLSRVHEAISLADGEEYHALTIPSADYTPPSGSLPMLGTVTWPT